jgi:hypothetical protein
MFAMMKRVERAVLKLIQSLLVGARNLTSSRPMQLVPEALLDWMASDDTGTSSKTIAHVLSGVPQSTPWLRGTTPSDSADFGRCVQLLQTFPEWQGRLGEVAEIYPQWRPIVFRWNELARLWCSEQYGECSRMLWEIHDSMRPPTATDYAKASLKVVK